MGNRMNFADWGRLFALCAVAFITGCSAGSGMQKSGSPGGSPSPSENSEKWEAVRAQLEAYSGESYPVKLSETGQWGQAYPGGIILLDRSAAEGDVNVLAFKLAHEWAHHVLGHVNPHTAPKPEFRHDGAPVEPGTETEDAADRWAGRFLAEYGYDLEAVADYLRVVPPVPKHTIHSTGPRRAQLVLGAIE